MLLWAGSARGWGMEQEDGGIRSSRSLSDTVTFAQVFLSVLALLFYPVGLLTLWLQIRLSYTLDGLTAWYATSLLPVNFRGQGSLS